MSSSKKMSQSGYFLELGLPLQPPFQLPIPLFEILVWDASRLKEFITTTPRPQRLQASIRRYNVSRLAAACPCLAVNFRFPGIRLRNSNCIQWRQSYGSIILCFNLVSFFLKHSNVSDRLKNLQVYDAAQQYVKDVLLQSDSESSSSWAKQDNLSASLKFIIKPTTYPKEVINEERHRTQKKQWALPISPSLAKSVCWSTRRHRDC